MTNSSGRRRKIVFIIFLILTLACVAFIFSNSLSNGEESSRQSGKVVQAVLKATDFIGVKITNVDLLSHIVRKCAHFLEFALLGALSFLTLKSMGLFKIWQVYFGVGFCLLIAACDEYIQTFRSGRSGQVSDVFLDLSGSVTAIAFCILITFLIQKHKKKKEIQLKNKEEGE